MQAIGLIETKGLLASIESADVMLKTADVTLVSKTLVGGGLVTITVQGDVAAVKASVDAGAMAVKNICPNLLISQHVIPRPIDDIGELFQDDAKITPHQVHKDEVQNPVLMEDEVIETQKSEQFQEIIEENIEIEQEETKEKDVEDLDKEETQQETQDIKEEMQDIEEISTDKKNHHFDIKTIDKKNFKRENLEKINKEFGKHTALKALERLNLAELRKLLKEYSEFEEDTNISKQSKAKIIDKIIGLY